MRNRGLHRGAEEINLIKFSIFEPTLHDVRVVMSSLSVIRQEEDELGRKAQTLREGDELLKVLERMAVLRREADPLVARLARLTTLIRVLKGVMADKAGVIGEKYKDPKLAAKLNHPEALLLRELEELVYA